MENWNKLREEYRDDDGDESSHRGLAYEDLANAVGCLVREALEGHGLDTDSIRDAIAEALDEELGPVAAEEETIRDEPEDPFASLYHDSFGKK